MSSKTASNLSYTPYCLFGLFDCNNMIEAFMIKAIDGIRLVVFFKSRCVVDFYPVFNALRISSVFLLGAQTGGCHQFNLFLIKDRINNIQTNGFYKPVSVVFYFFSMAY